MTRSGARRPALPALLGLSLLGLAACSGQDLPLEDDAEIANPASVHCEEQDGTVSIVDTDEGEVGVCVLPDGSSCEEWALYRDGLCEPVAG